MKNPDKFVDDPGPRSVPCFGANRIGMHRRGTQIRCIWKDAVMATGCSSKGSRAHGVKPELGSQKIGQNKRADGSVRDTCWHYRTWQSSLDQSLFNYRQIVKRKSRVELKGWSRLA